MQTPGDMWFEHGDGSRHIVVEGFAEVFHGFVLHVLVVDIIRLEL